MANIKIYDKVNETLPSAQKIYKMAIFSYPLSWVFEKLHLTSKLWNHGSLSILYRKINFKLNLILESTAKILRKNQRGVYGFTTTTRI